MTKNQDNDSAREKYYELKKVLAEYRGIPYEKGEFSHEVQSVGKVKLSESATLFENVDEICFGDIADYVGVRFGNSFFDKSNCKTDVYRFYDTCGK